MMNKIKHLEEIDSTNKYVKSNLEKLSDRTAVSTNHQTGGYGRFKRAWIDLGEENIYMTFVLKPDEKFIKSIPCLTQYLSVITCKIIEEFNLKPEIKWPNDVLIDGKKVCGILAEGVFKSNNLLGIALGVGINLNSSTANLNKIDRLATSLNLETGRRIDKTVFETRLFDQFFDGYDLFLENGFELIKKDYEKRACFIEKNLEIAIFDKIKKGYCKGVNSRGELILEDENKTITEINMGEIIN